MAQHSRSSVDSVMAFDFSTPAAVMMILKSLREKTELETAVRNEIRDLIFSYTNGSDDDATRQTIETRLNAVGITPESIDKQKSETLAIKKEAPKSGFSNGRTAPSFNTPSSVPVVVADTSNTASSPSKPPEDTPPAPSVIEQKQQTPVAQQQSDSSPKKIVPTLPLTPTSVTATQEDVVSMSKEVPTGKVLPNKTVAADAVTKASDAEVTAKVNLQTAETKAPTATSSTPAETLDTSVDTASMLERIRTIKADINARAGNPVNLVSMDNSIGREYMAALLDAMKQLGSGNATTISDAMKRLELAYEQALSVIEINQTPETSVPEKPATPVSTSAAPEISAAPIDTHGSQPSTPAQAAPQPAAVQPSVPEAAKTPAALPVEEPVTPANNPPLGVTRVTKPTAPTAPKSQPAVSTQQLSVTDKVSAPQTSAAVPIHSSKTTPTKSVAMATPLRKVEELPTLAEVKNRSESGNPLYTQEISDGLEQLLTEWVIFRKSGIFGTGPHGTEHPLFKKLAPLKIPLIIAGRFEGATDEVRQSITGYMNGWRYEQGIVYEKEETFENYLRRVIRHIIDLQK